MATVKEIADYIDSFAPFSTQCQWDNCGLLIGCGNKQVKKVGFALDLTPETLDSALKAGVDLIITHHPVIFRAQKNFLDGDIAYEAAVKGISVISAHTCFDVADGGINDVLCEILEITDTKKVESAELEIPMLRIGNVKCSTSLEFAKTVSEKLGTVCRVVDCKNEIKRVAVCGGAGMDFYFDAVRAGADAYVTGDISHHEMLMAKSTGITVIAAGHFETENPSIKALETFIKKQFSNIETILLTQTNPITFIG